MAASKFKIFLVTIGLLLLAGALSLFYWFDPGQVAIFPKCPFHSTTGFYCPGCGSQRALHSFTHGDLIGGLRHNLLIGLLILVLIYQAATFIFKDRIKIKNIFHQTWATNTILIVVLVFWLLRNINYFPFNLLAP